MAILDRLKARFFAVARAANPTSRYVGAFRARLLKALPNLRRVDVEADSPAIGQMANIPVLFGVPGFEATFPGGKTVRVFWEDGRPDRPFACLWEPGEAGPTITQATWYGERFDLGGKCTPVVDGVVHGQGTDPFTGLPYWMLGNTSQVVNAKKTLVGS